MKFIAIPCLHNIFEYIVYIYFQLKSGLSVIIFTTFHENFKVFLMRMRTLPMFSIIAKLKFSCIAPFIKIMYNEFH